MSLADSNTFTPQERTQSVAARAPSKMLGLFHCIGWAWRLVSLCWVTVFQFCCLTVLLAIASSIPLIQFASLGYLLEAARRIADNRQGESKLPGLKKAGRLGIVATAIFLLWLPVWLVSDLEYSANLMVPGSNMALAWKVGAILLSIAWIAHCTWALLRGGRWYHFLWPAPIRFVKEIWRPKTWLAAEDALWNYTVELQLVRLGWLGLRAFVAVLVWFAVPGLMIVIGMRAHDRPVLILTGFIGATLMSIVVLYVPFLQVYMAQQNRFLAAFDVAAVRRTFKKAPLAFFVSLFLSLALTIPLYLFRIESLPTEVLWLPCLFFVLLGLPARAAVGWAMRRGQRDKPVTHWVVRYIAWGMQLASLPFYIGFMYLATLATWDGAAVVFLQHAFMVPVPFSGN